MQLTGYLLLLLSTIVAVPKVSVARTSGAYTRETSWTHRIIHSHLPSTVPLLVGLGEPMVYLIRKQNRIKSM